MGGGFPSYLFILNFRRGSRASPGRHPQLRVMIVIRLSFRTSIELYPRNYTAAVPRWRSPLALLLTAIPR